MKDELQGKLVEILASMQSAIGAAKDFTLAQLPDIAQSYLIYGRVSATVYFLLAVALALAGVFCIRHGRKLEREGDGAYKAAQAARASAQSYTSSVYRHEYGDGGPFIFPGAGLVGAGCLFTLAALPQLLLVWLAPKVWLLKELAALIK